MISEFKICKNGDCGLTISGLEQISDTYLPESSTLTSKRTYKYSESVTINAIQSIDSFEIKSLSLYEIKDHKLFPIDDSTFDMSKDGIYEAVHIILPTKTWLDKTIALDPTELDKFYTEVYYYDNGKIYKHGITVTEIPMSLFIGLPLTESNTIIYGSKNTFNMCHINKCFYTICQSLLDNLKVACKKTYDDKRGIYNRDVLWMAINSMKYAIDTNQIFTAQKILENINSCTDLCGSTIKHSSCGCNS